MPAITIRLPDPIYQRAKVAMANQYNKPEEVDADVFLTRKVRQFILQTLSREEIEAAARLAGETKAQALDGELSALPDNDTTIP
jgi:hypothetical protein